MDSDLESLELCPPEEYNFPKAKERASVLWLVSKAHNNRVPTELRDPYYRDHEDQYRLKPQIVQGLSSGELYCMALASIYADPNYHTLSHVGIISTLQRKGVDVLAPADPSTCLNETTLNQNAPIRMAAHMCVVEAIMDLYIKEVLIPLKVFEVVRRYSDVQYPDEVPSTPEEAALLWINAASVALRERIQLEAGQSLPPATIVQDMAELSDGCGLSSLLSFYCPDALPWQELCLNDPMNLTDSLCNLQLLQAFCEQNLPHDICFLTLEDLLFMHETIRPNVLALVADLMYLFEIRPAKCVVKPGWELEEDNDLPHPQEEVQYNYTLRKARKLQNSCSHIPDLLLQPEGMLQRDKKGRTQRGSSQKGDGSPSKDGSQTHNNNSISGNGAASDPEELEQFSGYFNKMNIGGVGTGSSTPSERNSHSAHASPAHQRSQQLITATRRSSSDKTGREANSQDGNSTLENYYTQFNSIEDGDAGLPLRRVPSQSHIQNFSGSQAALQMMDPDAPDPFEGARDNKQTSFAQLSSQNSSSQVNLTYRAERRGGSARKQPTTTWIQQTPTGEDGADVEEMFAVRQQMDERRQRIEQERRTAQETAKKERTQAHKQVFQQVVGGTSATKGTANSTTGSTIASSTPGPKSQAGGGTSTSDDSDRRSPTPPLSDNQRRRRNSAERAAKQEQVLNSLIHSRSASHVNHMTAQTSAQPSTFYLHDGSPMAIHGGYPSPVMRRQWGPPAAPAMYAGFGPSAAGAGYHQPGGELLPPYWAAPPHPSWGASRPPPSLNHAMLMQQQFATQPYTLHEPLTAMQQQPHQSQQQIPEQHQVFDPMHLHSQLPQTQQQQQQQQQSSHLQQRHQQHSGLYRDTTDSPSPPPPARPERKKRDSSTATMGQPNSRVVAANDELKHCVEQQENTPPGGEKTASKDKGAFFISFGNDVPALGDTKATVTKPKPKLRPRIQPSQDEADQSVVDLRASNRSAVVIGGTPIGVVNSATITKSEGKRLSTRLDHATDNADDRVPAAQVTPTNADGFVIGGGVGGKPLSEQEMARKKEMIMLASLKRRQQQEQLRLRKESQLAAKRAQEQARRDEAERKREEDRRRREAILEQHRLRKMQEEAEKNGGPPPTLSGLHSLHHHHHLHHHSHQQQHHSMLSSHGGGSVTSLGGGGSVQRRPKSRSASVTRPRPKSVHIGALASAAAAGSGGGSLSGPHQPPLGSATAATGTGCVDGPYATSAGGGPATLGASAGAQQHHLLQQSSTVATAATSAAAPPGEPVAAVRRLSMGGSQQGLDSAGRGVVGGGVKREPSYHDFSRYRGPPSDGASDSAASTTSSLLPAAEYTGPKLFVKPSAKSNRSIILNALNVVLAGAVNAETKKRATNEINATDAKHLLILFRGANLQFRGIYTYSPEREEVLKIFGAGPKNVTSAMLDLFYKYNSGSKSFTQIHTKHLSATIDAFTIQNALWMVRKSVTSRFASAHSAAAAAAAAAGGVGSSHRASAGGDYV